MSVGIPPEILRLTAHPFPDRLSDFMGTAEKRSPICGSRVIVDVSVDDDGHINALGMRVNACAFGQAASAILAKTIVGRHADDVISVRNELAQWIAGDGDMPSWPDIDVIRPDRLNSVRKASVQLAFQAAAEAAQAAAEAAQAAAAKAKV